MPYQTSVGATAVKIKELVDSREIEGIRDINDESAKGKTRLVIDLKRDAPALVILNNLYKRTPLQTTFSVNTVALVDGVVSGVFTFWASPVEVLAIRIARLRRRFSFVFVVISTSRILPEIPYTQERNVPAMLTLRRIIWKPDSE